MTRMYVRGSLSVALAVLISSSTIGLMPTEAEIFKPPGTKTTTLLLAYPQDLETTIDTPVLIQLQGSAPGGGDFAYWIYDTPDHGALSEFDAEAGSVVYTPDADYQGTDNFRFKLITDTHYSDDATVAVTVTPSGEYLELALSEEPADKTGGKNWTFAIMFRDGLLENSLDVNTIPESSSGLTLYEALQGPLGMALEDTGDGFVLAYGEAAWAELTRGQKIWLLENFYEIAGLT